MSDGTVEVVVTPPEDTPPVQDAPDVVVVDTGDSGSSDTALVDIARQVGELTAVVNGLVAATVQVEETAEQAEATAELALDIAVETPVEAEPEPEPVEPDEPPAKPHWTHRPFRDLFGGK